MARTKKTLLPVDTHIAEVLSERVEHSGLTRRELAAETGMSMNRLGIILRKQPPPATVGEVGLIAGVLGTTASAILAEAEHRANEQSRFAHDLIDDSELDDHDEVEAQLAELDEKRRITDPSLIEVHQERGPGGNVRYIVDLRPAMDADLAEAAHPGFNYDVAEDTDDLYTE